jgi:phosphomannomutase
MSVIARQEGFNFQETLIGFKWLCNAALDFEKKGGTAVLAFEEAIGFGVLPGGIPDRDAVAMAAVIGEMAHWLAREERKDLLDKFEDIYGQYGYFLFDNSYFMCRDARVFAEVFARMRQAGPGGKYIDAIGEFNVARIRDITLGWDSETPDNKIVLPRQNGQMLTFYVQNGCVATIRTSGTEPKIKWYSEIGADDKAKATKNLAEVTKAVQDDLLQREKHGLKHADG